ncbi:MAG: hypothetical protein H6709_14210 [Kofleriaceae bacterium]|nr:hypothetical protein [Kofleriaceae bacterium]
MAWKPNSAEVWLVGSAGRVVIEVSGATVSTVQVRVAGVGSRLPTMIGGADLEVWLPPPRPLKVVGDTQAANGAAVETALEGRAGLGRAEREGRVGRDRRVVRRRQDRRVGRDLVDRPDPLGRAGIGVAGRGSVARTSKVWLPWARAA